MLIMHQNVLWSTLCEKNEIWTAGEKPSFPKKEQGKEFLSVFVTFGVRRLQNLNKVSYPKTWLFFCNLHLPSPVISTKISPSYFCFCLHCLNWQLFGWNPCQCWTSEMEDALTLFADLRLHLHCTFCQKCLSLPQNI